jgi:prepilin-type N-terminal cleavage/methylation domain-containing protein
MRDVQEGIKRPTSLFALLSGSFLKEGFGAELREEGAARHSARYAARYTEGVVSSAPTRRKPYPSLRSSSRGVTLIELMIVLAITAILAVAIGYAFTAELTLQRIQEKRRAEVNRSDVMEREITRLLQGAKLSANAPKTANTTSYFWGLAENGASDLGCDRLTFTTTAPAIPMAALGSMDDFETQQGARGPVGGLAEVSLSTTAVGDSGGRSGLFERIQRPADSDPSQGGAESDLDFQVERMGFQFWDGLEWVSTWSTTNPPHLPAAVQVRYTLYGTPSTDVRVFVVPIPASDVDANQPATGEGKQ